MIDTIKIVTQIDEQIYKTISFKSDIKCSYNKSTGELYYEIINDGLDGTYDSRLSVRVSSGSKYGFFNFVDGKTENTCYALEIEGSYHKIVRGQNAFDGFYNIGEIGLGFIKLVENAYDVKLPKLNHWFLQRIDITKCFDVSTQQNVLSYIKSLKNLSYPRRHVSPYYDGIYCTGQITTLKIYDKYTEFIKHDKSKLSKFINFNMYEFIEKIQGYIRFECEIKKKKLMTIYNKKYIRLTNVKYEDLEKVWSEEFMRLLKFENNENIGNRIRTKEEVKLRLQELFNYRKASVLYSFFILILNDGYDNVKEVTPSSTFYRNVSELKLAGIDFSQSNFNDIATVDFNKMIDFDPFTWKEVV